MMMTFLISAVVIGLVITIMAVGVLFGRAPIKGSCGGLGALGIDQACEICGGNPQRCEEETREGKSSPEPAKASFYPADRRS
ncbi:(Na+)-NQR maturation NqrM [Haliea sp. E17]|uniref:(Na+)-NQR maturation NqrM n=1 Tax=Haliea sp. E17 TaxID=3401576 RepID=UPI003AAD7F89